MSKGLKCLVKDCINKIDGIYPNCIVDIDKMGKVLCFKLKRRYE